MKRDGLTPQQMREDMIAKINLTANKGTEVLGGEPIGFVLVYPNAAFIKVLYIEEIDSRENTAKALMDASLDEMGKA